MKTQNLLERLQKQGIELKVDDDNLRYVAPKGALTDELRQAIKAHKAELIERLRPRETSEQTPPEPSKFRFTESSQSGTREPGEDEAGIMGVWPPKAWSLADWVKGARGDFHVRATLTGDQPISRGVSWKD